jgi:hypothetical protein
LIAPSQDGWNAVVDLLNAGAELVAPSGLKTGYHNHELEFTPVNGKRPIETVAAKTNPSVMLQLDVGACIQARVPLLPGSRCWRLPPV